MYPERSYTALRFLFGVTLEREVVRRTAGGAELCVMDDDMPREVSNSWFSRIRRCLWLSSGGYQHESYSLEQHLQLCSACDSSSPSV